MGEEIVFIRRSEFDKLRDLLTKQLKNAEQDMRDVINFRLLEAGRNIERYHKKWQEVSDSAMALQREVSAKNDAHRDKTDLMNAASLERHEAHAKQVEAYLSELNRLVSLLGKKLP